MQLGMIGLGRMGANMAQRLRDAGHDVVGYDRDPAVSDTADLPDLVSRLAGPRAVWIMVPHGAPTRATVDELAGLLRKLPPSTPVAVVRHASLSTQRAAIGTLGGLEALIETHRLASPSIIIVGDVLRAARVAAGEAAPDVGTDGSSLDAADGATDGGTVSGTDSATDATMDRAVGAVARQGNGASARSSRLAHRGGGASPDGENPLAQPSSRALY